MILAKRPHTVGNTKRFMVNYVRWLPEGVTLSSAVVTSSSATATISNVSTHDARLFFFVVGGVLNETFTVTIQITDTIGQVRHDTIEYSVVPA